MRYIYLNNFAWINLFKSIIFPAAHYKKVKVVQQYIIYTQQYFAIFKRPRFYLMWDPNLTLYQILINVSTLNINSKTKFINHKNYFDRKSSQNPH